MSNNRGFYNFLNVFSGIYSSVNKNDKILNVSVQ